MAQITQSQLKKIHVLARNAGMDSDLLHIYVEQITGKDSLKILTMSEAIRVIDKLEGKESKQRVGNHMTDKQRVFMLKLVMELGWLDEDGKPDTDRLNHFIKARFGADHYRFLSSGKAGKVIEGLKAMLERERREQVC